MRSNIMEHLARVPGASTRGIARAVGISESTANYHLRRMHAAGEATMEMVGREACWYNAGHGLCPVLRRALPLLRRDDVRAVALALVPERPSTSAGVARATGVPVGAVRWAAGVLVEAGIAERTRGGRILLAPGADVCVAKAVRAEPCALWGECTMSRAFEARGGVATSCPSPSARGAALDRSSDPPRAPSSG